MSFEFCREILEKIPISNFMKIRPMKAELFQTDRQTDIKTLIIACLISAKTLGIPHIKVKVKVKQSHYRPGQALRFQEAETPIFQDNRHMKVVRLSALRTVRLYPQEIFLVLISVRG